MTNGIFVICSLGQELEVPVYKFVKEGWLENLAKTGTWNLKKWLKR
jgi:hypothetical protein